MCNTYHTPSKYDEDQKKVISLDYGHNLVLAPPGCGKTEILAERIARAYSKGVEFDDMLCLTFTNRASREMGSRIKDRLGEETDTSNLFVGNIHRFCSKFLFDNNLIPLSTSILDENDSFNILQDILRQQETLELDYLEKAHLNGILSFQHFMYQKRCGHDMSVITNHDECMHYEDEENSIYIDVAKLCMHSGISDQSELLEFYDKINYVKFEEYPASLYQTLQLMRTAKNYEFFKIDSGAIDFDDLLLITYNILIDPKYDHKRYSWIQVDEVQDLNPLQFAIIDELTAKENHVVVYLGDEQQAIFSFIGAKMESLNWLKKKCEGRLMHLNKNYRSPKYLLDMLNSFANYQLDIDMDFLPKSDFNPPRRNGDMVIDSAIDNMKINAMAAERAVTLSKGNKESVAIIVNSNNEADSVGSALNKRGIEHFKISGIDAFSRPDMQMLISHFGVVNYELENIAWAKIIRQLKLFGKYSQSRAFARLMFNYMLTPVDLMKYKDSSMVKEVVKAFDNGMVIFDTETTGLDIFNDDIVQIAALKIKDGTVTDKFNVFLKTDKEIPKYLGDIKNPLVEEYENEKKLDRKEGLQAFLHFVGKLPVLGHNVEYDYRILQFNLRRVCGIDDISSIISDYYDSLKLARLVVPHLRQYKLKSLLETLGLEGENSHMANDDIVATYEVVKYCIDKAKPNLLKQEGFFIGYSDEINKLRELYSDLYNHTISVLYNQDYSDGHPALVRELIYAYKYLLEKDIIESNKKFEDITRFLEMDVVDATKERSLYEQLNNHVKELNTFRETDLCGSSSMKERFFVSTVHKAKGLEFDNVIVTNVVDDVYPFFKSTSLPEIKEDARKLYVAMSRSKKRLHLLTYETKHVFSKKWGKWYTFNAENSRFLRGISSYFDFGFSDESLNTTNIEENSIIKSDEKPSINKEVQKNDFAIKTAELYDKIISYISEKEDVDFDKILDFFSEIKKKDNTYRLDSFKVDDDEWSYYRLYFHKIANRSATEIYKPEHIVERNPINPTFFKKLLRLQKYEQKEYWTPYNESLEIKTLKAIPASYIPSIWNYLTVSQKSESVSQVLLFKELTNFIPDFKNIYTPFYLFRDEDVDNLKIIAKEHLLLEQYDKLLKYIDSKELVPNCTFNKDDNSANIVYYLWKPKHGLAKVSQRIVWSDDSVNIQTPRIQMLLLYNHHIIDESKIIRISKEEFLQLYDSLNKRLKQINERVENESVKEYLTRKNRVVKNSMLFIWSHLKYGYIKELDKKARFKIFTMSESYGTLNEAFYITQHDYPFFDDPNHVTRDQYSIFLKSIKEAYNYDINQDYDFTDNITKLLERNIDYFDLT